jgi:hypothetical protein
VAGWPATSGGVKIPDLPKVPKVTSYPVTIDTAGYVDFEWTWDNQQTCIPGYAKTVSEELSFELGRPRRSVVNVVGGAVSMPFAIGGEAKLKAKAGGFKTTNFCPPTAPEPEPSEPDCRTLNGRLGATLSPEATDESDATLVPLGHGVLFTLIRKGGGSEPQSCIENRPTVHSVQDKKGANIETTSQLGPLSVPLGASSTKFWSLKPGGRISRTIKIGGGCDTATAQASRLSSSIKRCTIGGRIVVVIKRLR